MTPTTKLAQAIENEWDLDNGATESQIPYLESLIEDHLYFTRLRAAVRSLIHTVGVNWDRVGDDIGDEEPQGHRPFLDAMDEIEYILSETEPTKD